MIAYILLVLLPVAFDASLGAILLFQPDVGWIAVISGIFAIVWGITSTSIRLSTLRPSWKQNRLAS